MRLTHVCARYERAGYWLSNRTPRPFCQLERIQVYPYPDGFQTLNPGEVFQVQGLVVGQKVPTALQKVDVADHFLTLFRSGIHDGKLTRLRESLVPAFDKGLVNA